MKRKDFLSQVFFYCFGVAIFAIRDLKNGKEMSYVLFIAVVVVGTYTITLLLNNKNGMK